MFSLIAGTCEYVILPGKNNFANVIKVKETKMGRLSHIIFVGQSNHEFLKAKIFPSYFRGCGQREM